MKRIYEGEKAMEKPNARAEEIHTPEGHQVGSIYGWDDGYVTLCISSAEAKDSEVTEKAVCHTSRKPEGKTLYNFLKEALKGMGYHVLPEGARGEYEEESL